MAQPDTSLQFQLDKPGGNFTLVPAPRPVPEANEVCIRTKAVALNPLDWKDRLFAATVASWPAVLGIDAAGIVDAVGSAVTAFKPGDEVFSLAGIGNRQGAYQEIVTVPSHFVAKKPASLSFEEAASLPICYLTASAAIANGLKISLQGLGSGSSSSSSPQYKSILVLGGSSAVGGAAIQILRLALPSATILATSSAPHHDRLVALGATSCFERSAHDNPAAIIAASPGGKGVDAILDVVAAAASQPNVFDALSSDGPRVYSQVYTGDNVQAPEGVNAAVSFGRQIFGEPGGLEAMATLVRLIEEGKYKLPVKVEVVGKGFEAIPAGLDRLMKGVSGTKLVVSL